MKSCLTIPTRWPWLTLIIALLLTGMSILLISRLKPETSLDAMLNPHDPATRAMSQVMRHFPAAEEMLILISSTDESSVDQTILLKTADQLADALIQETEFVSSVRYKPSSESRAFIEKVVVPAGLLYLGDAELVELQSRLTLESMTKQFQRNQTMLAAPGPAAAGISKTILQDPLRLHELLLSRMNQLPEFGQKEAFVSPSGRDLLMRIEGKRPPSDLDFSESFTRRVRNVVLTAENQKVSIRVAGAYAITAHNASMIRRDAIWDCITASISLGIVFLLFYRQPFWAFLTAFLPVAIGITCGFGVYAIFHSSITPLAAVIGGAMGGIGIDYSTHLLAHYRNGKPPVELIQRLFLPLLAACVTSVIGFAVIGWSQIQLLRDFALVGSLSLIGAFVAAATLLPAILTLRPIDPTARINFKVALWRRPSVPVVLSLLLLSPIAIVASGVNLQQIDPDLANLHPQPNPPLDAQNEISDRMSMDGSAFMVHVQAGNDTELLQKCANIQSVLQQSETRAAGLKAVIGASMLLPDPKIATIRAKTFSDENVKMILSNFDQSLAASDFSPDRYQKYRELLAQLLQPKHIPDLSDLRQYPELADTILPRDAGRHEAITYLVMDRQLKSRQEIASVMATIQSHLAPVSGSILTGLTVINQQILTTVQRDLPRVALLAGSCVFLYLLIHYRSFLLAFLAMVPTIVSLIGLLAAMRVTGITLNVVNLVMVPLLLGINIDFGIFAADTLRKPEEENLEDQYRSSLRAMLTCATTAVIGFGSLVITSIPAVRSLGWLVNIGVIGCCLGASFLLWPIVIMIARRRQ